MLAAASLVRVAASCVRATNGCCLSLALIDRYVAERRVVRCTFRGTFSLSPTCPVCVCVFFFFALDIPLPSRGRREGLYVQWKMFGMVYFILFHEICMYACDVLLWYAAV
jgi:hypothetical protein